MDSERILKKIASITYELDISWDSGVGSILNGNDSLLVADVPSLNYHLQLVRREGQLHLPHHRGFDVMQ